MSWANLSHQANEHFPVLQLMLPNNRQLVGNTPLRALFLLSTDGNGMIPSVIVQQHFTLNEWCVLRVLLGAYPQAVPYQTLLAALHVSSLHHSQQHLHEAQRNGYLRETLRPVRDTISRLRPKVRAFSIGIAVQAESGYVLTVQESSQSP